MNNSYILEIKDLTKEYNNFKLNNININLKEGSIMGFIGANGSGKSTTIKSILNIIKYDSGQIFINGINTSGNDEKVNNYIGYVGDEINLYSDSSAKSIYKFIKNFYEDWDDNIFHSLIGKFNLNINKKIKEFSKGMKVQFMISLALSHHAKLFILDEPTSGLDPIVREEILNILYKTVKNENASVFFSSHITEDIQKIADRITYINEGGVLLSDSKDNILNSYKKVIFKEEIPEEIKIKFKFEEDQKNIIHVNNIIKLENILQNSSGNIKEVEYRQPLLDEILIQLIK